MLKLSHREHQNELTGRGIRTTSKSWVLLTTLDVEVDGCLLLARLLAAYPACKAASVLDGRVGGIDLGASARPISGWRSGRQAYLALARKRRIKSVDIEEAKGLVEW
jgi:hypothetical protein